MAKDTKTRNRGSFTLKFSNNKTIKFRTAEAYSNALEVLSRGRFANVAQMYDRVKQCPTGFEFTPSVKTAKEYENRFNVFEFEE